MEISRISHIPQIIRRKGWTRRTFIREVQYHADVTRPTATKIADGATDLDLSTLEKLSVWLGVGKDEILETKVKA